MRFAVFVLASLVVVGCGTTTFTSDDGGGMSMSDTGTAADGGPSICAPPCTQVVSLDLPVCLEASSGFLFYATEGQPGIVGRVDKLNFSSMATASLMASAADCTLYGSQLLVGTSAGAVLPVTTGNIAVGQPLNSGQPLKRITSRFLAPPYVAGIRNDGVWGCDSMWNCRMYMSSGSLSGVLTDGDWVYFSTEIGINRCATNAAAVPEPLVAGMGVTAMGFDFTNIVYATPTGEIYTVGKQPAAIAKMIVDKMPGVSWIMTDVGGMYWTTADGVWGSHKDGNSRMQYATRQPQPSRIVTDDTYIYWINHAPKAAGGGIYRIKK